MKFPANISLSSLLMITDRKLIHLVVKAFPNSKRNAVEPSSDGPWKVRVQAPADRGAANEAIIALLAKHWSVRKRDVVLKSGVQTRNKVFEIHKEGGAE